MVVLLLLLVFFLLSKTYDRNYSINEIENIFSSISGMPSCSKISCYACDLLLCMFLLFYTFKSHLVKKQNLQIVVSFWSFSLDLWVKKFKNQTVS